MVNKLMKKHFWQKHKFATILVTVYLVVYVLLHQAGASLELLGTMFLLSPFLVIWMAYTILKYAPYKGKELGADEEWGYADKDRNDPGIF